MLDDGNNFAWRQKPSRQFTAAQARDQGLSLQLSQAVYYSIDSYAIIQIDTVLYQVRRGFAL